LLAGGIIDHWGEGRRATAGCSDAGLRTASAALVVAEKAADIAEGAALAAESIDSGKALAALEKLVEVSNR